MSKDRLQAFSDGVFAIVLTLLVLELHTPNISDRSSLRQYAPAMAPLAPKVMSFIFSCTVSTPKRSQDLRWRRQNNSVEPTRLAAENGHLAFDPAVVE